MPPQDVRERIHQILDAKIATTRTKRCLNSYARNPPGPTSPSRVVPAAIIESAATDGSGAEDGVRGRAASGAAGSPAPGARAAAGRTRTGPHGGGRQAAAAGRAGPASRRGRGSVDGGQAELFMAPIGGLDGGGSMSAEDDDDPDKHLLLHHSVHGGAGVGGGLLGLPNLSVPPGVEAALIGDMDLHLPLVPPPPLPPPPPPPPLPAAAAGGSSLADSAALGLAALRRRQQQGVAGAGAGGVVKTEFGIAEGEAAMHEEAAPGGAELPPAGDGGSVGIEEAAGVEARRGTVWRGEVGRGEGAGAGTCSGGSARGSEEDVGVVRGREGLDGAMPCGGDGRVAREGLRSGAPGRTGQRAGPAQCGIRSPSPKRRKSHAHRAPEY